MSLFWRSVLLAVAAGAIVVGAVGYLREPPSIPGSIILNSPTIYTRQRLVNDRLSQANWLNKQLEETERDPEKFKSLDAYSVTSDILTLNARVTANGEKQNGSGEVPARPTGNDVRTDAPRSDKTQPPGGQPTVVNQSFQVDQTTFDRFLAMKNYRDAVRTELMQTLLDDRHDILGNTVYRLGYDATIFGGKNNDKFAIVYVQLTHDARKKPTQSDNSDDTNEVRFTNEGYETLYENWINYTRSVMIDGVRTAAVSIAQSQYQQIKQFDDFLDQKFCKFFAKALNTDQELANKEEDKCMSDTEGTSRDVNLFARKLAIDDFSEILSDKRKLLQDQIESVLKTARESLGDIEKKDLTLDRQNPENKKKIENSEQGIKFYSDRIKLLDGVNASSLLERMVKQCSSQQSFLGSPIFELPELSLAPSPFQLDCLAPFSSAVFQEKIRLYYLFSFWGPEHWGKEYRSRHPDQSDNAKINFELLKFVNESCQAHEQAVVRDEERCHAEDFI